MIYHFTKNEKLINIIDIDKIENDTFKREINKEYSYTFTINFNDYLFNKGDKIGFKDQENIFHLFIIQEIEDTFSDKAIKELYCIHDYISLNNTIIEDKRIINSTAQEALKKALEGTSYNVGTVTELGTNNINYYYISNLKAIHKIINVYGGELNYRIEINKDGKTLSKYVDILYRLGKETGLRYTFDTALTTVKRIINSNNHFTVLYGRGKSLETDNNGYTRRINFAGEEWSTPHNATNKPYGDKFIEDPEAIKKWGRIEGIYDNSNIDTSGLLLEKTWEKLQETKDPEISYECTIEYLKSEEYQHYTAKFGDSIILLDQDFGLRDSTRIIGESYSLRNFKKQFILGTFLQALSENNDDNIINTPGDNNNNIIIDNTKFPDTLPDTPQGTAKGGFSIITINWTYSREIYYQYEVYASKLENFNPNFSNLIFRGQASNFIHEVKPRELWFYKIRAINTHNRATDFSNQITASTAKIGDAAEYIEEAAIQDALIGTLKLDRAWAGQLSAEHIDARTLRVIDGNGVNTLHIDSFGRVFLNVNSLQLNSVSVATQTDLSITAEKIENKVSEMDYNNQLRDSGFRGDTWEKVKEINLHGKDIGISDSDATRSGKILHMWGTKANGSEAGEVEFKKEYNCNILAGNYIFSCFNQVYEGILQIKIYTWDNTTNWEFTSTTEINIEAGHVGKTIKKININKNSSYIKIIIIAKGQGEFNKVVLNSNISDLLLQPGVISTEWSARKEELYNNIVGIDVFGLYIKQDNGSKARFTDKEITFSNNNDVKTLAINNGGVDFHDATALEKVAFIKSSFMGETWLNGVTLSTTGEGDYISIGYSNDMSSSTWKSFPFILFSNTSHANTGGSKGTHFYNHPLFAHVAYYAKNNMYLYYSLEFINNTQYNHAIFSDANNNNFCIYGADTISLGIRSGDQFIPKLELNEYGNANAWTDLNFNGYQLRNVNISNNYLNNNRKQSLNTYMLESINPEVRILLKDQIINNVCEINIPVELLELMSSYDIVSLVKYGPGDIWIESKTANKIIIKSTNDIKFSIELSINKILPALYTSVNNNKNITRSIPGSGEFFYFENIDKK